MIQIKILFSTRDQWDVYIIIDAWTRGTILDLGKTDGKKVVRKCGPWATWEDWD